jgi:predicted PurR-regulated permease PerM
VLVVGSADNLLRPRLVGGRTQMHDLLIFFSVLGGLQVFGMVGLLVGPVVFAVTRGLLAAFTEPDDAPERPAEA